VALSACFKAKIVPLGGVNNIANENDYQVRFSNISELRPARVERMNVYLHAQGGVRPKIKKALNTVINKALRAGARRLGQASKTAADRA